MLVGMSVCPWCKAEVIDAQRPCPKCGKLSAQHPAFDFGGRDLKADPGGVPDLVIPAAAPKAAKPKPATPAAPAPPAFDPSLIDGEDVFGSAADVKLDLDFGETSKSPVKTHGGLHEAPKLARAQDPSKPSLSDEAALAVREPASDVDPFEVRAVADFGPKPAHWWQTPKYAYRVKTRQSELRRLIVAKKAEAAQAEEAAEDALIAFGQRARGLADSQKQYGEVLQAVTATEDLFRARDTALAAQTDAHRQRQAHTQAKIDEMEAQVATIRAEEARIQAELEAAEGVLKRAEARLKRAEIEIRNATTVPQGGAQAPDSRRQS
jgi:hypothetical protein